MTAAAAGWPRTEHIQFPPLILLSIPAIFFSVSPPFMTAFSLTIHARTVSYDIFIHLIPLPATYPGWLPTIICIGCRVLVYFFIA